ncbi:DMT family transporter [Bradyrhizobium sp. 2TAF24]|uniref:DMT family transporter n=1 Tax=Bradyrhizobium sp. 2TAF24 TaxID=3233011 RepID=UPI003F93F00D
MTSLLFAITALLWGGGALATAMQAGITPASWSVALRMALAGMLLLGYGRLRGLSLGIPGRDRIYVALQGALFFSLAFVAFYEAVHHIPSGLAAVILSLSSLFAALLGRVVLGSPLTPGFLWGAGCGVAGVAIIAAPQIHGADTGDAAGYLWALAAAIATAGGTVTGARNQRAGLPPVAVLGWAALVGAATSAAFALATGTPLLLDGSLRYLASLAYLTVAGSCVAFMLYFELVRRTGPGQAAYALAVVPVIALGLSALFEGLHLDTRILVGAAFVLAGNLFVLRR